MKIISSVEKLKNGLFRVTEDVAEDSDGFEIRRNVVRHNGSAVVMPVDDQQRILLEPRGSRRLSSQSLLDVRLSRKFSIRPVGNVELLLDVLNALNDTAEEALATDVLVTETIKTNPDFGRPTVFMDPRRAMLGVRLNLGRP